MTSTVLDSVLDQVLDGEPVSTTLVDIPTAAERLGLTVDGVRKRLQCRQLVSVKRDGRVYVVLDAILDEQSKSNNVTLDPPPSALPSSSTTDSPSSTALAESLAAQLARADVEIAFLRGELERKDTIIMRLVEQRALPAASEATPPVPVPEAQAPPRPWWARLLGRRTTPE